MGELVRLKRRSPARQRTRFRTPTQLEPIQPFLDAITANLAILDTSGRVVATNAAWRSFAKVEQLKWRNCALGANYLKACDSVDGAEAVVATAVAQGIRDVLAGHREAFEHDYPCHSAREERWFLLRATRFPLHGRRYVLVAHHNITRFKRVEAALQKNEDRLRLLLETAHVIPWEADATTWRFTYVGPQAWRVLGYPVAQWYEKDFWTSHIHPEDREYAIDFCAKASRSCDRFEFEYRMLSEQGEAVWFHDLVSCIGEQGEPKTLRGFMIDITERKKAEQAQRESEQRLRTLFDCAPEAMIIFDVDAARFVDVNDNAVRLFGLPREILLRMNPFHLSLTPRIQPNGRLSKEYGREKLQEALSGGTPRFEWVHHDSTGKPIICEVQLVQFPYTGKSLVRVNITDITLRRQAEAQLREQHAALQRQGHELRNLAAQLITVQDEERRRMACELHDDTGQRLALIAQRISHMQSDVPPSAERMTTRLQELRRQVVQISTDIRRLAHELHPSVLDDLGLEIAAESYTEEFARHRGITVAFKASKLPTHIPRDVTTCLYRVMQEGLGNIARHAHASRAAIRMRPFSDGILLLIRDWGVGFDTTTSNAAREGLGLISMRERARLVDGTLSMRSAAGKGTRIRCWVPLKGKNT